MIKHLDSKENLESVLTNNSTIVDFHASWCGPCKMFSETLEQYLKEEDIPVIKIDIDNHNDLARDYGVMVVPTIMLFKNKTKVKQVTGFMDKDELKDFIKN